MEITVSGPGHGYERSPVGMHEAARALLGCVWTEEQLTIALEAMRAQIEEIDLFAEEMERSMNSCGMDPVPARLAIETLRYLATSTGDSKNGD